MSRKRESRPLGPRFLLIHPTAEAAEITRLIGTAQAVP
jgi:hypothetical protein